MLKVWWFTYRNFIKPYLFLQKLIERFEICGIYRKKVLNEDGVELPEDEPDFTKTYSVLQEFYYEDNARLQVQQKVLQMLY